MKKRRLLWLALGVIWLAITVTSQITTDPFANASIQELISLAITDG